MVLKSVVVLRGFVDEGDIVDVIHSSQSFHVPKNVDVDRVWKVEWNLTHQMEEQKFV